MIIDYHPAITPVLLHCLYVTAANYRSGYARPLFLAASGFARSRHGGKLESGLMVYRRCKQQYYRVRRPWSSKYCHGIDPFQVDMVRLMCATISCAVNLPGT